MSYYKNTTQTPNSLFDLHLKHLSLSELKVLLTIVRKTIGVVHPSIPGTRLQRAWISQKLFMRCTSLSGRAVSSAIGSLVDRNLIVVSDGKGNTVSSKSSRRGSPRLYYASRLRLDQNKMQTSEHLCNKPVKKGHTIKLNTIKQSCYNGSQGIHKLTDTQRYLQIKNEHNHRNRGRTD